MTLSDPRGTLYTLRGSGGALIQALMLGNPLGNYDVMVGDAVDHNRWRVIEIPYLGGIIDLYTTATIEDGVTRLVAAINETPGPFAFVGMSQGATVCSEVYKRILDGDLTWRSDDFLGGIMFGNPEREAGHTIPGGTDPGGHGVAASARRLVGSEDRWWEFAEPTDFFAVVNDDEFGDAQTSAHEFLMLNWTGEESVGAFFATMDDWPTWSTAVQNRVVAMGEALLNIGPQIFSLLGFFDPGINTFGHLRYHLDYTGLPDTKSAVQLAVEHLNSLIAPRLAAFGEPFVGTDHDDFTAWARELREYRIERAYDPPKVRLYDGDWIYRGTVAGEIAGKVTVEVNETGLIQIRLPIDLDEPRRTWAAFWALDEESRGTSNIHIVVEMMGARVSGRMKGERGVYVTRGEDGDEVTIDFLDDIEELKYIHTAGNPFLPISLIQQPKAWMLYMPADYAILLTMAANLLRLSLTNIDIGGILGLLNPANWNLEGAADALFGFWQPSQIVIKPRFFDDSAAPLALVVGSIKTNIFDVAAPILEDAELQWEMRRWLNGDPEPWPGAGTWWIRQGTLFVDIVDKSGFRKGTSLGGNLLTGLTRTIADVTSNHVEDSYDLFTGATIDETGYRIPGILGTLPPHPHVVYRDGDVTGIQTSEFARSPGGPGRITVGGESMPGVDELISAAIQYGGDVAGDNIGIVISQFAGYNISVGSLGGAIDSFLNPIYRDSILAHMSVPLLLRVAKQGWGHYLETTSTNVTKAYTPSSVMDLRRRRRETDEDTSFTLKVANASPYIIGDNGFGHWWLGDRVGGTQKYLMPRVYVRRNTKLDIEWGESKGLEIEAEFGDTRKKKDALERIAEVTAKAMTGLQEIGLW